MASGPVDQLSEEQEEEQEEAAAQTQAQTQAQEEASHGSALQLPSADAAARDDGQHPWLAPRWRQHVERTSCRLLQLAVEQGCPVTAAWLLQLLQDLGVQAQEVWLQVRHRIWPLSWPLQLAECSSSRSTRCIDHAGVSQAGKCDVPLPHAGRYAPWQHPLARGCAFRLLAHAAAAAQLGSR
jgi:hypothetical protein